jgi:hypothetical protein
MEDHNAAWAWLALAIDIAVFVAGFDIWAHYSGHISMTRQMQKWLLDMVIGPFAFALWLAVIGGLLYHLFLRAQR